jgi:hypothetical protein
MNEEVFVNIGNGALQLSSLQSTQYILNLSGGSTITSGASVHVSSVSVMKNADWPSKKIVSITSPGLSIDNVVFNQEFPDGVLKISLTTPANGGNHSGVQLAIGNIEEKTKVVIDFRQSGLNLEGIIGNENFRNVIQKYPIAYLWNETAKADETSQFLQFPVIGINVLGEELVKILGDNDLL